MCILTITLDSAIPNQSPFPSGANVHTFLRGVPGSEAIDWFPGGAHSMRRPHSPWPDPDRPLVPAQPATEIGTQVRLLDLNL